MKKTRIKKVKSTAAQTAPAPAPKVDQFADPLIKQIQEMWRRRQDWHRAEKSLTLMCSAICRRYAGVTGKDDKAGLKRAADMLERCENGGETEEELPVLAAVMPLLDARRQLEPTREKIEKRLEKLVEGIPIFYLVEETKGFGALSLAGIVGEAGDLSAYKSVQAVGKRMGVAVINGERQRKKTDRIEALAHGYNPRRRSVLWNVGGSLIGGMGKGPRPKVGEDIDLREDLSRWQKMFVDRMRLEVKNDPDHARPPVEKELKTGEKELRESFSSHAANRAKRYVEKQFLKFLVLAWRAAALQGQRPSTTIAERRRPQQQPPHVEM